MIYYLILNIFFIIHENRYLFLENNFATTRGKKCSCTCHTVIPRRPKTTYLLNSRSGATSIEAALTFNTIVILTIILVHGGVFYPAFAFLRRERFDAEILQFLCLLHQPTIAVSELLA